MEEKSQEKFIYALSAAAVYDKFDTDPKHGLSEDSVNFRLKDGLNQLPAAKKSFVKTYIAPLFNTLILLYLIAGAIMLIAGSITGEMNIIVIFSLGMVGMNIVVSIYQQIRATKKMKSLRELSAPTTNVIRNGEIQEILSKNVVVGDILTLDSGDRIPADARIVTSSNLYVNEASLTGESEPVHKNRGNALDNKPYQLQNQDNILFFGTFITTGRCKAVVYASGSKTEIGKISKDMEDSETAEIPIRKKLDNLGKNFAIGIVILWLAILGLLYWRNKTLTGDDIITSLESCMNMLPVNILVVITIIMLTGVVAMADHGVIIRNITSVDSLGRVSAVCTDKTGTLTKSQMCVQYIWARGSRFHATGSGYDPKGDIFLIDRPQQYDKITDFEKFPHLRLLLEGAYLNNNAVLKKYQFEITKKRKKHIHWDWKVIGSATEGALLTLVKKSKLAEQLEQDLHDAYDEVHEYNFSSDTKRMTKIFRNRKTQELVAFTKGASERMIMMCDRLLSENNQSVDFATEIKLVIMNTIHNFAVKGYRMLSFAYKPIDTLPDDLDESRDEIESDLIFIGFVAIMDPPRDDVSQAITECTAAGVDVIMITGDALPTAKAIAEQVGIINHKKISVLEGNQLEEMLVNEQEEELKDLVSKTRIFSRVLPKHKETIVKLLQKNKKVVAMTGDGVNDALALNMADAGIAMGIQGTDVAKEAADMIISDDSFGSIVEGIRRGRGIYANIRSAAFFYICISIWEGLLKLALPLFFDKPYFNHPDFFYLWLLISQVIHTWPAFILGFDSISKEIMKEKPRDSQEIMSKPFLLLLVSYGLLLVISILVIYFLGYYEILNCPWLNTDLPWGLDKYYLYTDTTASLLPGIDLVIAKTLTMVLCVIFITEFVMILQIRRPNKSLLKSLKEDLNKHIWIQFILVFGVLLVLMYFPGLQVKLQDLGFGINLMFLNPWDWFLILVVSCIPILGFEGVKKLGRKKNITF